LSCVVRPIPPGSLSHFAQKFTAVRIAELRRTGPMLLFPEEEGAGKTKERANKAMTDSIKFPENRFYWTSEKVFLDAILKGSSVDPQCFPHCIDGSINISIGVRKADDQ
jgi:hypothetical protein